VIALAYTVAIPDGFIAHTVVICDGFAYTVAISGGFIVRTVVIRDGSCIHSCYDGLLIRFMGSHLGLYPRWHLSPIRCLGVPFCFDCDMIAVRFQQLEVAQGFRNGFNTRVLVICDGSMPTQLLPALGYAHTVATSVRGCYPQWPSGLCGCYLRSDCYLYGFLAMHPSSFLFAFFTYSASGVSGQAVGIAYPLLSPFAL
jgi:hypothetical protein